MADLDDAVAATGATSGAVISRAAIQVPNLTAPQKAALVTFVQSLGAAWPGNAAHIESIQINRQPGPVRNISVFLEGFVVHADAAAAVTQKTAGNVLSIIGKVP